MGKLKGEETSKRETGSSTTNPTGGTPSRESSFADYLILESSSGSMTVSIGSRENLYPIATQINKFIANPTQPSIVIRLENRSGWTAIIIAQLLLVLSIAIILKPLFSKLKHKLHS